MARYWEDYKAGDKFKSPGRTMTEAIVNVCAGLVGLTEAFFWNEEEARKSIFGSRVAPGCLTLMMMDSLNDRFLDKETSIALVGIEGRFQSPVRVNDTIRVESEITKKRETRNPARGLIICESICYNQRDEAVAKAEIRTMVMRRQKEA